MSATPFDTERHSFLSANSSSGHLVNTAVDYIDNHVDENVHPAFTAPEDGHSYDVETRIARTTTFVDEEALSDCQKAFSEALTQYEKGADPRYKTGLDIQVPHTWEEVLDQVEKACNEYKGVGKEGMMMSIRCGLRNFHTAAPAIEAWLKLLPSTSIYGSVLCGGLTMILEVHLNISVRMRMQILIGLVSGAPWEAP